MYTAAKSGRIDDAFAALKQLTDNGYGRPEVLNADNALLSTPFVNLALVPEAASSLLMPLRIGYARAFEMFALGEPVDANSANNAHTLMVTVNPSPTGTGIFRYRLYSDVTKEHHFTTDLNEYNTLGAQVGTWAQKGTVGKVLNNPGSFNGVTAGDQTCAQNQANRPQNAPKSAFLQALQHQWDDQLIRERSPIYEIGKINVPIYTVISWQDEQVGPRAVNWLSKVNPKVPLYATVTNGDHGMYRTDPSLQDLNKYFDHYLKGVDNGYQTTPRIRVWWEAGRNGTRAPG